MSEKEEQYSAYVAYQTNGVTMLALFSGFIFAAIIVVLAQYSNVAQLHAQVALFVLNFVLDLFLYQLREEDIFLINSVRVAPQAPPLVLKRKKIENIMLETNWVVLAMIAPILFLLWSLLYLACASVILSAIWILLAYYTSRPWSKWFKEHQWIRR
jgi:hypothetical protein